MNSLDSLVLSEVTSLLFAYVCDITVLLLNPYQNWIRVFGFAH